MESGRSPNYLWDKEWESGPRGVPIIWGGVPYRELFPSRGLSTHSQGYYLRLGLSWLGPGDGGERGRDSVTDLRI